MTSFAEYQTFSTTPTKNTDQDYPKYDVTDKTYCGYEYRWKQNSDDTETKYIGEYTNGKLIRCGKYYGDVEKITPDMTGFVMSKKGSVPCINGGYVSNGLLQGHAEIEVHTDTEYYHYQGGFLNGLFHGGGELRTAVEGNDYTHCHHSIGEFKRGVLVHGWKDVRVKVEEKTEEKTN